MQHLRRQKTSAPNAAPTQSCFTIPVTPPFRLDLTAWALCRRPINQIDRWDSTTYRRTLYVGCESVEVAVVQTGPPEVPRLRINVTGLSSPKGQLVIRSVLHRLLGLDVDLAPFFSMAARCPRLNRLAQQFRGMRPPRFPSIFEALVNGIACQQLSLEAGLILLNRLTNTYGQALRSLPNRGKAFPRPRDLACASVASLRALGFSRNKSLAIIALAAALQHNETALEGLDDDAVFAKLDALRGVGRWTAEYVLLRGYGRLNVFPADDVGARRTLQHWLQVRQDLDYARTQEVLQRWQPYSGLVYLHMLLRSLSEKGLVGRIHTGT